MVSKCEKIKEKDGILGWKRHLKMGTFFFFCDFFCVVLQRGVRHGSGEYGFDIKFDTLICRFLGFLMDFGFVNVKKSPKRTVFSTEYGI
jgi:hypothetical protein